MTTITAERPAAPALTKTPVIVIDLYCRISRDYDGTLRKVEDQEAQGRAWITAHAHLGYVLGKVWRDHALSGWNPKVERPDFNALLTRLKSGAAGGVWVRDLDRFTRKMNEGEALLTMAEQGRVVAAGHSTYDLTTARGKRNFREDIVEAAYESDRISERTSNGKRFKFLRGKSNASHRGYARPGYLPNPEGWEPGMARTLVPAEQLDHERDVVREMARRTLAQEPLDTIARDLTARGIHTLGGGEWSSAGIRRLLTSPSLAGLVSYKGEVIRDPDMRLEKDPALDLETWDKVQNHFAAKRTGRPVTMVYLLSGLMRCGKCGATLSGRTLPGSRAYPDGEVRRQYFCHPPRPGRPRGCGGLGIDQRFADDVVKTAAIRRLSDPQHASQLAARAEAAATRRGELLATRSRLEADGKAIAAKTATRGLAWVEAAMEGIDTQMEKVNAELADLDDPGTEVVPPEDVAARWAAAEDAGQIPVLREMVARAFPALTVLPANGRGKAAMTAARFDWDGSTLNA